LSLAGAGSSALGNVGSLAGMAGQLGSMAGMPGAGLIGGAARATHSLRQGCRYSARRRRISLIRLTA
jgi:hypothetical protein